MTFRVDKEYLDVFDSLVVIIWFEVAARDDCELSIDIDTDPISVKILEAEVNVCLSNDDTFVADIAANVLEEVEKIVLSI